MWSEVGVLRYIFNVVRSGKSAIFLYVVRIKNAAIFLYVVREKSRDLTQFYNKQLFSMH